jgi:uncharacterized membrane protein YfcA
MPLIPAEIPVGWGLSVPKNVGLLAVFAILMIATSISMIRENGKTHSDKLEGVMNEKENHHLGLVLLEGVGVGALTGLVGAGGGFLIIPALVLLAGLEMKTAVGTSLIIIAMKSLIGFVGDIQAGMPIEWLFLLLFTSSSVGGIFIGIWLNRFIDGNRLKKIFGWFVMIMGFYMIVRETMFR